MQRADLKAPVRRPVVLLALLAALGPLATDLYLPALPAIAADLATGLGQVQLTLGVFLAGFALLQLAGGPLSDRYGRRPVLIAGMGVFFAGSLLCAYAPSIEWLLAGRFVQAVGACAGPVVCRAIVRDVYAPEDAARVLAYIAAAMALAPLIAPSVGGLLTVHFGWQACFFALAAIAVALLGGIAWRLDETLAPDHRHPIGGRTLASRYIRLLRHREFVGYCAAVAFAFAGLFSWISHAPAVVIERFAVAPQRFGLFFAVTVGGYMLGALTSARIGRRLGVRRAVLFGLSMMAIASLAQFAAAAGGAGLIVLIGCLTLFLFGAAFAIPQGTAGALIPFPAIAGTASALIGFLQMLSGLFANWLSSRYYDGTEWPMIIAQLCFAALALGSFLALTRSAPR